MWPPAERFLRCTRYCAGDYVPAVSHQHFVSHTKRSLNQVNNVMSVCGDLTLRRTGKSFCILGIPQARCPGLGRLRRPREAKRQRAGRCLDQWFGHPIRKTKSLWPDQVGSAHPVLSCVHTSLSLTSLGQPCLPNTTRVHRTETVTLLAVRLLRMTARRIPSTAPCQQPQKPLTHSNALACRDPPLPCE